jgi:phosphate transport system permease protein
MKPAPVTPQQAIANSSRPSLQTKDASKGRKELMVLSLTFLCASISILTTAGIIGVLAREAFLFFQIVSPIDFFTGTKWSPTFSDPQFGVLPLISGTLMITVGAAIIAVPLGLLAAIYMSEYAKPKVRRILKPVLEVLAGIPTVVYGYFALFTITPFLRTFIPDVQVFNALSGAIVVGIMILPLVSSLCEDALSAVPKSLRDGGLALGSTKYEVTRLITVPAAFSGIMAAVVLAISRAIGETMAVSLAAGQTPNLTLDPRESIQTMTAFIVQISHGDTPEGSMAFRTIFAVGATLFVITMLLNIIARRLVRKFRQVYA